MDIALSLAAGLGLRFYLVRITAPPSFITPAIVGLWEGVLIHQLSFHPPSSTTSSAIDHCLAFGLRLVIDLLIAGNWARVALVGVWAAIGAVASESAFPGILNRNAITLTSSSSGHRGREKRYRRSQSAPSYISSHVRVYQAPETPPTLPAQPPQTSTPTHPAIKISIDGLNGQAISSPRFPPPSPPSFFLQASSEPSPFPDSAASPTPILAPLPVRPHSSLAFYPEGTGPRGNGAPPSPHLPTPPDSTIRERTLDSRVDRLSTIDEITSRSEHVDNEDAEQRDTENEEQYVFVSHGDSPLPVPNPMSQYVRMEDDTLTLTAPDTPPLPIPPIGWQPGTPDDGDDELKTPGQSVHDISPESDGDELRTPPGLQARVNGQNGISVIPISRHEAAENTVLRVDKALSPLLFDSQSIVHEPNMIPSTSLSHYTILQPPVPPTPLGSLLTPVPPITSTSAPPAEQDPEAETDLLLSPSAPSDAESILSTRIPFKLLEHADDLRKQAIEGGKELDRLRGELKLAELERRPRDALFLRGDIQKAEEEIKKLHERASRRFFEGRNTLQKPGTIDVHGLKPAEALQKTEEALRKVLRNGGGRLNVIVGKGKHSKGGIPVIKNFLIAEMQKRYIPCRVDPVNSGILILNLPPATNGAAGVVQAKPRT